MIGAVLHAGTKEAKVMATDQPKWRDEDGKWGCLGCGYTLYPDGGPGGYCANVRCLLRHPYAAGAEHVIRLVKRVAEVECERDQLAQGIEDLVAVATTDADAEGYVVAYHFKTGALHRLLGMARQLSPGVVQNVAVSSGST